jgi:excinuclease UvrABC ATPase subunit
LTYNSKNEIFQNVHSYGKKLEIESSKNNKSMNLFLVCFRYLKLLPIFVPLQVHFKEACFVKSKQYKQHEYRYSEKIEVIGARVNNLKNIDVSIPRDALTVITGLSGSGKSSLAFDTIYAEGQRRYIETFSAYARNFLGNLQRPDVDKITGLSPVISIEQKTVNKNPRSTVGTTTEIYDFLRLLFARAGEAFSYVTGEKMVKYSEDQIVELILKQYEGKRTYLLAPLVRGRKGHYKELFEQTRKKDFYTFALTEK